MTRGTPNHEGDSFDAIAERSPKNTEKVQIPESVMIPLSMAADIFKDAEYTFTVDEIAALLIHADTEAMLVTIGEQAELSDAETHQESVHPTASEPEAADLVGLDVINLPGDLMARLRVVAEYASDNGDPITVDQLIINNLRSGVSGMMTGMVDDTNTSDDNL